MTTTNHDWNGRRVTVMGLGRFGGGVGVVRWLARQGAEVTLTDRARPDELAGPLALLRDLQNNQTIPPIKLHLGGHDESDFADAELMVVNPAVRPDNPWVQKAISKNIPITTEIGLFLDRCPGSIVAVTGSNGKSTTSAMLASILRADGRKTWLGGNLGGSLLGELPAMTEQDWAVLELSSFQITYLPDNVRPPEIVVVTNCVPNHLDWHSTFDEYVAAKCRLLQLQTPDSTTVLGPTLANSDVWGKSVQGQLFASEQKETGSSCSSRHEEPVPPEEKSCLPPSFRFPPPLPPLPVPGEHNRENAQAAATAAIAAGCSDASIERGLMSYIGLPDRLEPVGVCHGRQCINDTASTTPESTAAASAALPASWILVGGGDKGADFSTMLDELARSARGVAFYGAVGPQLYGQFTKTVESKLFVTLDDAFAWSLKKSEPGEAIILSPGCSSHDQFTNFVARGERFKRLVSEQDMSF